jgi:hypothetical protein
MIEPSELVAASAHSRARSNFQTFDGSPKACARSQPAVPELTFSTGIQLNQRLWLQRPPVRADKLIPPDLSPSGSSMVKPSVYHIPARGFVLIESARYGETSILDS